MSLFLQVAHFVHATEHAVTLQFNCTCHRQYA